MRQVPHYLIIGNGRVARHFQAYFSQLSLSFSTWNRQQTNSYLKQELEIASHVLLLISDQAIESFIQAHLQTTQAILLHFSGSFSTEAAYGAHPLMTFSQNLYSYSQYKTIPFIIDENAPDFSELLPGLPNPHTRLSKALKPKYHALCVMSGNFSCLLWQKLFQTFEQEFAIPSALAHPYLIQQMQNLMTNPETALTGPLSRNDSVIINKNIAALEGDVFQKIYKSFVACYETTVSAEKYAQHSSLSMIEEK